MMECLYFNIHKEKKAITPGELKHEQVSIQTGYTQLTYKARGKWDFSNGTTDRCL